MIEGLFKHLLDKNLKQNAGNYVAQSLLATGALLLILTLEDALARVAAVAAVASSTFLIFAVPHSIAASPRRVIGGHLVAVIVGSLFALLLSTSVFEGQEASPDTFWT